MLLTSLRVRAQLVRCCYRTGREKASSATKGRGSRLEGKKPSEEWFTEPGYK